MTEQKIEYLVLNIAANNFTVPLPTGAEVIQAVNSYDTLRAECERLREALEAIRDCPKGGCDTCLKVAREALQHSGKGGE